MKYIHGTKYLNEINIPGTYDNGNFDICQLTNNKIIYKIAQQKCIDFSK